MGWAIIAAACDARSYSDVEDPSDRRTAFHKTSCIRRHRVRLLRRVPPPKAQLSNYRVVAITDMCMTC